MWFVVLPWWMWVLFGVVLLPLYMLEMCVRALVGVGRTYHHATPQTQAGVHRVLKWILFLAVWPFLPLYFAIKGRLSWLACTWIYGLFIAAGGLGSLDDPTMQQPETVLLFEAAALVLLVPATVITLRRQRERASAGEVPADDSYLIAPR